MARKNFTHISIVGTIKRKLQKGQLTPLVVLGLNCNFVVSKIIWLLFIVILALFDHWDLATLPSRAVFKRALLIWACALYAQCALCDGSL